MAALLARASAAGIGRDGQPDDDGPCYLWPENVRAWRTFVELQTQWQVDWGVRVGLRYDAVLRYLREIFPEDAERADIFRGVRACEIAALDVWARQRQREQRARPAAR